VELGAKPKPGGLFQSILRLGIHEMGVATMRINLTREQKKDAAFWACIVSGIGFCVGGVFMPPLIPVGVVLLTGAIAIAKDTAPVVVQNILEHRPHHADDNQSSSSGENVGVNVQVDLTHRHHTRSRQFTDPIPNQPDIEHKENADRNVHKHHKRS
jgi:hypothetical protein